MKSMDSGRGPGGKLTLQVIAMPKDTNPYGDIFAGWLMSQMDLAAATAAGQISKGRATTVAIDRVEFLSPVSVGDQVSCYTDLLDTGRSSMKIRVEVFVTDARANQTRKVTEGVFIYVAINDMGGIRQLPSLD
ncbi:MAG: acyl-CoA thioesterase YciA [Oleiphilaceae bacterium]|jgi:acyl-CoA thioesterase YciA